MAERMMRCPDGHFYDANKHSVCPWCATPVDIPGIAVGAEGKTKPMAAGPPPLPQQAAAPAPPPAPMPPKPQPAGGMTRRFGSDIAAVDPVVGWLVCMEGPDKGRDFRIKMEKNFIGRASNMDISIPGDDGISRERHGVVIFDPKNKTFWLAPGESAGLVYLNGNLVHAATQMQPNDVIEIGKSKLVLIPFCGDKYQWV